MRARKGTGVSPPTRVKLPSSISLQKLCLQRRRHVADLVEEQRALARPLGIAEVALLGSGEGALLVAEDFTFEKLRRDCRAVHGDEGIGGARTKSGAAGAPPLPCPTRFPR